MKKKVFLAISLIIMTLFISIKVNSTPKLDKSIAGQAGQNKSSIGLFGLMVFTVDELVPDSLAAKAGLQTGDLIRRVNNAEFFSVSEFNEALKNSPDKKAQLMVLRFREKFYVTETIEMTVAQEGLSGATGTMGYFIQDVQKESAAKQAGLRTEDLITKVDGKIFSSSEEFRKLRDSAPGTQFIFHVQRRNSSGLNNYQVAIKTTALP